MIGDRQNAAIAGGLIRSWAVPDSAGISECPLNLLASIPKQTALFGFFLDAED
jgi:hypothetical protein